MTTYLIRALAVLLVGIGSRLFFGWPEMPDLVSWRPWCGLVIAVCGLIVADLLGTHEAMKKVGG